jgi:UDP-glucose 4-epimerase
LTDKVLPPQDTLDARAFNVGTGRGTSVNVLAKTVMRVSERAVEIRHAPERRGELRHSALDAGKIAALGWRAEISLADGLAETYYSIAAQGAAT